MNSDARMRFCFDGAACDLGIVLGVELVGVGVVARDQFVVADRVRRRPLADAADDYRHLFVLPSNCARA